MANFKIHGGKQLSGEIETGFSKNAALPILCASLLTKEKSIIRNVPKIEEISRFEEIFISLGIKWEWVNERDVEITPPSVIDFESMNVESAIKTRSIIYLIGVFCHSYDSFRIPGAGGCQLGKRSTEPHVIALEKLGLLIEREPENYLISKKADLVGDYIVMYESGDTATCNTILGAVLAKGKTTIKMASANYMVQDLCHALNSMGAKISGIGTTILEIEGVQSFDKLDYEVMNDPIESMFFVSLAISTNSKLTIKKCPIDFLELELCKLEQMNLKFDILRKYKSSNSHFDLVDIEIFPSDLIALPDKIYGRPFPGLNIDNLPYFIPICTQAEGRSLIFDWCYEDRALYYTEFKKLGCNIFLADSHRVIIEGKTPFQANELICPPALRPATMLLSGMIAAKGTSILRNTYPIDRGHEDIYERLRSLGAQIEEIE